MVPLKPFARFDEYDKPADEQEVYVEPERTSLLKKRAPPQDYRWERDFPQGIYTDEDIAEMLEKVSPRQITYADLQIRGLSQTAAAERSAVRLPTAREWEQTPWWEPLLERRRKLYYGDKSTVFLPLMPKALERLEKELTGDCGNQIAHDAAAMIIDQVFGKPTQQKVIQREGGDTTLADLATVLRAAFQANEQLKEEHRTLLAPPTSEAVDVEIREVS